MSVGSRIKTWWRAVSRPSAANGEMQEELEQHIACYAEELMRQGVPQAEATRRAKAEMGSLVAGREKLRAAWGARFFDELYADLRFAVRKLRASPGFALIAVGSLALGIGANTAIFNLTEHVLLDRLNVWQPQELRMLWWSQGSKGAVKNFWGYFNGAMGGGMTSTSLSYPVYETLRKENRSFESLFAFKPFGRMTAVIDGRAESVTGEMISGNYYASLGVRPALGRAIDEGDDSVPGGGPVVVISDELWTRLFNRSASVIGKAIELNATRMTVVGVNPPGFTGAYTTHLSPEVFFPLSMLPIFERKEPTDSSSYSLSSAGMKSMLTDGDTWWVLVMGRKKLGVSDRAAAAELTLQFNAAVRATMTVGKEDEIPRLELRDGSRGQNEDADWMTKPIDVLLALAGFVLLLACVNLANLLLARSTARQREVSVRLALGARRGRILRQMFTENLLLALLGGAAGLLLAYVVRGVIPDLLSRPWEPTAYSSRIDWPIFVFAAVVSVFTAVVFGVGPAWQATRGDVNVGLKENAQSVTRRRKGLAGRAIVVVQVALAMLLTVGAGLFVRTLLNLENTGLGFQAKNLLLFDLEPPANRNSAQQGARLFGQLEDKLRELPGVRSVTLSENPLVAGNIDHSRFVPAADHQPSAGNRGADFNMVGEQFFTAMGIPVIAGRGFTSEDTATSTKVAVIDSELGKKFFPDRNPLGQVFTTDLPDKGPIAIVGICGSVKYATVTSNFRPTYYLLYRQRTDFTPRATFEISTRMEPDALVAAVRRTVERVDNQVPVMDLRTQTQQIDATLQRQRLIAELTAGFGVLALVLACIGIYGMMAYTVSRRSNEIGIRMALGASSRSILGAVLLEAFGMAGGGIAVGLVGALLLGRTVASLLFGLRAWDLSTLVAAAATLMVCAIGASWIPARRAATIDPIQALRHE
ncbi:MAG: ABC transporter permease [Terracidiphilus sp.]